MSIQRFFIVTAALCVTGAPGSPAFAQGCQFSPEAQYRVEFDATWSASTLPQQFPPNPHFSGLVGGSHGAGVSFWSPGGIASQGIENMAETGSKSVLLSEVNGAINAGTALDTVNGGGVGTSPGSVSTTFDVDVANPLATIVTMIAPSPDWFVGVHGFNLLVDGNWVAEATVPLFGYDAGTDSGPTYTSPNADVTPHLPITLLDGSIFMHDGELVPFGSFRFVRLTDSCIDSDGDGVGDETDNCTGVANAGQLDGDGDGYGNACDGDLNNDCAINAGDLGVLKSVFFGMDPVADLSGDGVVNAVDLGLMKNVFFGVPGPSALTSACD